MIPPSRDITGLETAHIRRILPCMLMVVAGIGQLLGLRLGSFLRERNNLTIAEMEAMKG